MTERFDVEIFSRGGHHILGVHGLDLGRPVADGSNIAAGGKCLTEHAGERALAILRIDGVGDDPPFCTDQFIFRDAVRDQFGDDPVDGRWQAPQG